MVSAISARKKDTWQDSVKGIMFIEAITIDSIDHDQKIIDTSKDEVIPDKKEKIINKDIKAIQDPKEEEIIQDIKKEAIKNQRVEQDE